MTAATTSFRLSGAKLLLAAALAVLLGGAGEAAANASLCRALEKQLASASSPVRSQVGRYDKAIADQKKQIATQRNQIKEIGCGFFSFSGECSAAKTVLKRMENNLHELERTRNGMDGSSLKREQGRILASLREKGCRADTRTARSDDGRRERTLFERLFGRGGGDDIAQDSEAIAEAPSSGSRWSGGNFRTLCVRTCDGYYFPISYSSNRSDFDRDTKACAAMCPGTETALFHHRVPSEESEQMVSAVTGKPYAELPKAFAYREAGYVRGPSCGCGTPRDYSIIAGEVADPDADDAVMATAPQPRPRPDRAEDAETEANRAGGLDMAALERLLAEPEPEPMPVASIGADPAEREVRVVGPAFLPDPEGAIDLRAPARREIR